MTMLLLLLLPQYKHVAQVILPGCNCAQLTPQSSRGLSPVACPNILHRHPSHCRCHSCQPSSGLLAELIPTVLQPREWQPCREEAGEVMSPSEESLTAKLDNRARPLQSACHLSAHSLAFPSRGTGPSAVEGRGTHGQCRAHTQMDHIEATGVVTQRCRHCPRSFRVSPGQAQAQGCGWGGGYVPAPLHP